MKNLGGGIIALAGLAGLLAVMLNSKSGSGATATPPAQTAPVVHTIEASQVLNVPISGGLITGNVAPFGETDEGKVLGSLTSETAVIADTGEKISVPVVKIESGGMEYKSSTIVNPNAQKVNEVVLSSGADYGSDFGSPAQETDYAVSLGYY